MAQADVSGHIMVRTVSDWTEQDGTVVLRQRKFGRAGSAVLRLFRIPDDVTVHLDPLGTEVWHLLDGQRTVAEILRTLADRHPEEPDLARRLGAYLSVLAMNRLVRVDR